MQTVFRQQQANGGNGNKLRNSENQRPLFHISKSQKHMSSLARERMSLQILGSRCAAPFGQTPVEVKRPGFKVTNSAAPSRLEDNNSG